MTGFAWGLLAGAFFSIILVIYWLTEKPKAKQPRSQYTLPPVRDLPYHLDPGLPSEIFYKPPEVIGTIDLGVKNVLTKRTKITDFKPVGPPPSKEQIAEWEAEDESK